jgi:serine/threonine-protein kinase
MSADEGKLDGAEPEKKGKKSPKKAPKTEAAEVAESAEADAAEQSSDEAAAEAEALEDVPPAEEAADEPDEAAADSEPQAEPAAEAEQEPEPEPEPEPARSVPEMEKTAIQPGSTPPVQPPPQQGSAPPGAGSAAPMGGSRPPLGSNQSFGGGQMDGGNRGIQIGDVLNHIFEVQRFIARGGMGEVFEGINVNSEERVAIKVILPHLARDPQVQAMFRKEARTLTRLTHSSLVQYRVLAQEPQLGVFYIVTEYIDGANLSDVLKELDPDPAQLVGLVRRLAQGLSAAHELGAIHRDISPDNVMLEDGRLDRAKIIDFGIAKDLDAGAATIVGDGFAGKLNYVAPEQLGEYGRSIGPWTDVYSLALTVLAVCGKKDVDMGGTLVDAVDKRRAPIDMKAAPRELLPVLQEMLKANPEERLRSMEEVIDLLPKTARTKRMRRIPTPEPVEESEPEPASEPDAPAAPATEAAPSMEATVFAPSPVGGTGLEPEKQQLAQWKEEFEDSVEKKPRKKLGLILGGIAGLAVIGGGGYFAMQAMGGSATPAVAGETGPFYVPPQISGPFEVQKLVNASAITNGTLAELPCSWLELTGIRSNGGDVALQFGGVVGRSGDSASAQAAIDQRLGRFGIDASTIDFSAVRPVNARDCRLLQTMRAIRSIGQPRLTVESQTFEIERATQNMPQAGVNAGDLAARPVFEFDLNGLQGDLAVIALDGGGNLHFGGERGDVEQAPQVRPGVRRIEVASTSKGWEGVILLTGNGPFPRNLLEGPASARSEQWSQDFLTAAQRGGWKAEMVWYQIVDERPN